MIYMFWLFDSLLFLLVMSFQDLKSLHIDDRINYIMMGVTMALIAIRPIKLMSYVILIVLTLIFRWLVGRMLADGDKSVISWLILGWGVVGTTPLLIFLGSWILLSLVYAVTKALLKLKSKTPYYPVFLGAQMITTYIFTSFIYTNVYLNQFYH